MKKTEQLRKVAEGREAEMFAWGEGAILRLLRDADAGRRNEWQAAAMAAARSRGVRVPAVLEATTVMGRPGLVMERIEGTDLLTLIGRRPWTVFRVARVSGEVQARLHEVVAPETIPDLRVTLRERIESVRATLGEHATFALDLLAGLPDGDRLCHGDFHPGNILMDGSTPVLIDWTNAMRGEATADVARTRLMLSLGETPPGTSVLLRAMALVGRRILVCRSIFGRTGGCGRWTWRSWRDGRSATRRRGSRRGSRARCRRCWRYWRRPAVRRSSAGLGPPWRSWVWSQWFGWRPQPEGWGMGWMPATGGIQRSSVAPHLSQ